MKSKLPIIVTAVVAACIVCIAAVLGIKMNNGNSPAIDVPDTYENYQDTTEHSYPVYNEITAEATTDSEQTSVVPSATVSETVSTTEASTETTEVSTTLAEKITQITTVISGQFSKVFDMPKAPKYIPPDTVTDPLFSAPDKFRIFPE